MKEPGWEEGYRIPVRVPSARRFPLINLFLFIATVLTTLMAGAMHAGVDIFHSPLEFYKGYPFSIALLLILLCHEMGHYYLSRRWRIEASLPYFLPVPPPFFAGTMGAVIKMKGPIPERKALLDVGAAGPLAGFIVAIPTIIVGLQLSEIRPHTEMMGFSITLGSSLLFELLTKLVLNVDTSSFDIILHPIALAGWFGLLVTALNLMPVGQLDGGHIVYALTRRYHRFAALLSLVAVLLLSIWWRGWFVWAIVILIFGFRHPPVMNEYVSLDPSRKLVGVFCILVFILTFTPVPFTIM